MFLDHNVFKSFKVLKRKTFVGYAPLNTAEVCLKKVKKTCIAVKDQELQYSVTAGGHRLYRRYDQDMTIESRNAEH